MLLKKMFFKREKANELLRSVWFSLASLRTCEGVYAGAIPCLPHFSKA